MILKAGFGRNPSATQFAFWFRLEEFGANKWTQVARLPRN